MGRKADGTTGGFLGIDAGTQGLSVILTDRHLRILATGEAGYAMVPGLGEGCYEQHPGEWESALRAAMAALRREAAAKGHALDVAAVGISGQMHGEVLGDATGTPLAAARLWCDGRNEAEAAELTERLGVKMPKRITAARFLWTVRHRPDLARRAAELTTPAGWIARRLTGTRVLGVGDAAGMFPVDQATLDFDRRLLGEYESIVAAVPGGPFPPLSSLLPRVARAGEDGGTLDARGADLLGLPVGTPVAPAEGDQPAALAGSLIGEAGQVSMSFGTSVVSNSVGDRPFRGISRAVDHFCAPDGKPINMVWIRNGTTPMNTVVGMFGLAGAGPGGKAFEAIMPQLLEAPDDCGGILALPFLDDEPGVGVQRGGTALVIGLGEHNATPGNVARAMLLATVFNLRLGSDVLAEQGYPRTEIVLSGGLTRTPELGQVLADAFGTPVTILDGAAEGTAWGAALLAAYRSAGLAGDDRDWATFLAAHHTGTPTRFQPRRASVEVLDGVYARYRRLLAAQPTLDAAAG
jgi:sugar (pentulose or hexulose) kinase